MKWGVGVSIVSLGMLQVREALADVVEEFLDLCDAIDLVAEKIGRELTIGERNFVEESIQNLRDGESPKGHRKPKEDDYQSWKETNVRRRSLYPSGSKKLQEMGWQDAPEYWDNDPIFGGWVSWPKIVVRDALGGWLPLSRVSTQLLKWFGLDVTERMLKRPLVTGKERFVPGWFSSGWLLMRDIKIALVEEPVLIVDKFQSRKGNLLQRVILPIGITDLNVEVPEELELGLELVMSAPADEDDETRISGGLARILDEKILHFYVRTGKSAFSEIK